MSALTLSRRTAFAGAAALALAPVGASACYSSEIALHSAMVAHYERKLATHRAAIDAAEALHGGAAPGWMYLPGETHALGEQRYASLITILKETPEDQRELNLMRRAAAHPDIRRGPRAWADFRVAEAEKALAVA